MVQRTWLQVWCEYEGPSYKPKGESFKILVETDEFDEARRLIRKNEDLIDDFIEHSIREPPTVERQYSLEEVIGELQDIFGVDWAISHNGQVYSLSMGDVVKESIDD